MRFVRFMPRRVIASVVAMSVVAMAGLAAATAFTSPDSVVAATTDTDTEAGQSGVVRSAGINGVANLAAGTETVGCGAPYPPIASSSGFVIEDLQTGGGESVPVTRVAPTTGVLPDGTQAVIQPMLGSPAEVQFPSGTVRLHRPGSTLVAGRVTDVDGDGVEEVWTAVGGSGALVDAYLVLSSSTPAGDHDVVDVGVHVPTGIAFGSAVWDFSGVPLIVVVTSPTPSMWSGTTSLLSGAAIVAAGPGGDARDTSVEFEVPGVAAAIIHFGSGDQLLTGNIEESAGAMTVRLFDGRSTTEFTTAPTRFVPSQGPPAEMTDASVRDGRRLIRVLNSNRGGNIAWIWSPDSPCEPLAVVDPSGVERSDTPTADGIRLTG